MVQRKWHLPLLLLLALALRLLLSPTPGLQGDLDLFLEWGETLLDTGFSRFYDQVEFCDYPPGYLYMLLPVAALIRAFPQVDSIVFLKLPAILFDVLTVAGVYLIARRELRYDRALLVTLFGVLNPMTVFNSSVYGQVDSIFTLFLILCIYLLIREKYEPAAALFAVALALKPQALLAAPLLLFVLVEKVRRDPAYWLRRLGLCVLAFAAVFYAVILPFGGLNPLWAIDLYRGTVNGYAYVSMNAYNLWWALGIHWVEETGRLGPLTYAAWGNIGIGLSLLSGGIFWFKLRGAARYYLVPGLMLASIFMLACRMHERYLFPAALFFLFAWLYDRSRFTLSLTLFFTLHSFLNQFGALYWDGVHLGLRRLIAVLGVAGLVAAYAGVILRIRALPPGRKEEIAPK